MGCVSSKKARSNSSFYDVAVKVRDNGSWNSDSKVQSKGGIATLEKIKEEPEKEKEKDEESVRHNWELHKSKSLKKGASSERRSAFSFKIGRLTEGEHIAAGWPAWLTAVAGEVVDGWLPFRSDSFERLEKIGQGTYSNVYRARDLETGKMVALKKVRFDNFKAESVRFMAREITILRRLDHPNTMKLEGIITSRLSCSIYLVFEYMEHDLSGLLSCPDIKFSDSQIKCYMRQLLCGLEHCHSRGVIHRDVKTSNILVNNEGILKIADFGLANFISAKNRHPLTSRVVTLWYRPPELLLGSTHYGVSVDMWSVGCVFAELFIGRPILKGRTEVEQLHKIFKLCGSPPDEYWKKSKLPLATMFKPQHPYESTLRERCREFPKTAVNLIETFLSIEPYKRDTASSALDSEYFSARPYACDPSSLPKYPPNKEIDAKFREEARRKKVGSKTRASGASRNPRKVRKPLQEASTFCKMVPTEEVDANKYVARRSKSGNIHLNAKGATESVASMQASYDTVSEASQVTDMSQGDSICSVPIIAASSGFAWAKRGRQNSTSSRLYRPNASGNRLHEMNTMDSDRQENSRFSSGVRTASIDCDEISKHAMLRQRSHPNRPDLIDTAEFCPSQESPIVYNARKPRIRFSGPLISQTHRDEGRQEVSLTHQANRRSRFYRDL